MAAYVVNAQTPRNRILWIDISKGLGILLVVLGHSGFPEKIQWWIWSFHMPLFFFISGTLFSKDKYNGFLDFLGRKLRTLMLPYLFFTVLVILGFYFIEHTNLATYSTDIFLNGWGAVALWFVPVLFMTELLFYLLASIVNRKFYIYLLILCGVIGFYMSVHSITFPYKVEVVFTSVLFFGLGNLSKESLVKIFNKINRLAQLGVVVFLLMLNIIFCFLNYVKLDLCFNIIGNPGFAYVSAIFGILFIILLSHILSDRSFFLKKNIVSAITFLGINSLIIVGIHQVLKSAILIICGKLVSVNVHLVTVLRHTLFWLFLYLIILFFNRYFYAFLGKKKHG